jgi:hypothetical protein
MKTVYADAIANMSFADGVIRFDLLSYEGVHGEKPELAPNGVMAMSLPALLRSHRQINDAVEKMIEKGLLTKTAPE